MAYTQQFWETGDTITAGKLNHIEDGIANMTENFPSPTSSQGLYFYRVSASSCNWYPTTVGGSGAYLLSIGTNGEIDWERAEEGIVDTLRDGSEELTPTSGEPDVLIILNDELMRIPAGVFFNQVAPS